MTEDIRLVHIADTHIGYAGSRSLVFGDGERSAGRYVEKLTLSTL